jgi:tetratricopeptide (TPR) repeat protein
VFALFGSAAAPAIRVIGRRSTRPWRWWAIAALAILALSTAAPYFADRYINEAGQKISSNPEAAIADLDRARDLNPLDNFPLLRKGYIQSLIGDSQGALASYRQAADLRPEDYASHFLIAQLEATRNPGLAQNEIRVALELNPLDAKVRALATRLGIPRSELVPIDQ